MNRYMQAVAAVVLGVATFAGSAQAEGDAARGKSIFTRCSSCHAVTAQNKVGPSLLGIFGRTAGTLPGAKYSKGMVASGIVWSDETLGTFLTAPAKSVPGTTMPLGVPNAQDRDDLIAYLKSVTP
ncbi:c-type cytochrome [Lacibacterium aquatile]|uniref:C-type cytochrome n=1 Tax=Lacibacterium aquatile TaxID=1168082 RepID=A0ABW5DP53_9PROT